MNLPSSARTDAQALPHPRPARTVLDDPHSHRSPSEEPVSETPAAPSPDPLAPLLALLPLDDPELLEAGYSVLATDIIDAIDEIRSTVSELSSTA